MDFARTATLTGDLVELVPLARDQHDELVAAASDGSLWELHYTSVPRPVDLGAEIDRRLAWHEQGLMVPFAVRRRSDQTIVGMTTYCNLAPDVPRLEIGYTWLARTAQRSGINTEAKLLLLTEAFEERECVAVQFCTNWLNRQSRDAIERLGAKQDGVLRNHMRTRDGELRDTVVFSITAAEWPRVRTHLRWLLTRGRPVLAGAAD